MRCLLFVVCCLLFVVVSQPRRENNSDRYDGPSDRYDGPRYRRNSLGGDRSGSISSIESEHSLEEVGGHYQNNSLSSRSRSGSAEPQGKTVT